MQPMIHDPELPRARVLVVDDLQVNRMALRGVLAGVDVDIVEAASAERALAACADGEFALILLDDQMPDMSSVEVARRLYRQPATRDTPIVFMAAAELDNIDQLKGYGAGAVDYILKPLNADVLCAKVRNLTHLYQSRRALKHTLRELDAANARLRSEIDERKRAEARAQDLATHDALTGLPNRLLFIDRLNVAMRHARRGQTHFALGYMDLDGFKPINDAHGHRAGDAVLALVAERLAAATRDSDTVARLGGDEFALIFEQTADDESCVRLGQKLRTCLSAPMPLPGSAAGDALKIDASMGIALYPQHGSNADSLMHSADCALYAVKNSGRADVRLYRPEYERTPVEPGSFEPDSFEPGPLEQSRQG